MTEQHKKPHPHHLTKEMHRKFKEREAQHFRTHHPTVPNGRDFMCFKRSSQSREARQKYRDNFDGPFPNAPGAGY